jgi:hypothetical protein
MTIRDFSTRTAIILWIKRAAVKVDDLGKVGRKPVAQYARMAALPASCARMRVQGRSHAQSVSLPRHIARECNNRRG